MACCLHNSQHLRDISSYLPATASGFSQQSSPKSLQSQSQQVSQSAIDFAESNRSYTLAHGGRVVKTSIGAIQFGLPPHSVQDSLAIQQEVPAYFIVPHKRFDKKNGVNVADFEMPCYYNFFIKKRPCTLICSVEMQHAVRAIFQETLHGPLTFEHLQEDYYYSYPRDGLPDFEKELKVFANNPLDPSQPLKQESLVTFITFDESHSAAIADENGKSIIKITRSDGQFHVIDTSTNSILESFDENLVISDDTNTNTDPSVNNSKYNSVTVWSKHSAVTKSIAQVQQSSTYNNQSHQQNHKSEESIIPPDFGITVLGSASSNANSPSTTGFIIWIYGKGIMVDPPPLSSQYLKSMGIPSVLIHAIIVTHCHSDHDAGTFAKLLEDTRIEVITTRTIMNSFLRKYSAVSGMSIDELKHLFIFRAVTIGTSINIYGAFFRFFYTFHSIPCIGFECHVFQKSLFYSSSTLYAPERLKDLLKKGVFKQKRFEQLANIKFNNDIILHSVGELPAHTPLSSLTELPSHLKQKIVLLLTKQSKGDDAQDVTIAKHGLKVAHAGIENSILLHGSFAVSKHMGTLRRLDLLSSIDIFENLTIKNIKWLLDSVVEEHYLPKQLVLRENTIGNKFYVIESGIARVYSDNADNKFERFYQTGEYFGETALMCHGGKRMANVEAVTELTLLTLEKHDFKFVFSDGCGGDGPVIRKFMNLTDARKSKALHVLYKNSVFNEMGQSQKTQLEMIVKEEDVEKGHVMWSVGDKAMFAFIIKKGTFEFIDCAEHDLDEFESGAFIGEVTAITENSPLTTSVIATRKAKVFKIFKEDLVSFLNKNPGIQVMFTGIKYLE